MVTMSSFITLVKALRELSLYLIIFTQVVYVARDLIYSRRVTLKLGQLSA